MLELPSHINPRNTILYVQLPISQSTDIISQASVYRLVRSFSSRIDEERLTSKIIQS
jgi:hypothetical protein